MLLQKLCPLLLLLSEVSTQKQEQIRQPRFVQQTIKTRLECIRKTLRRGFGGMSTFDPLHIDYLQVNLTKVTGEKVTGELNLHNLTLEGITGWNVTRIKGSMLPLSFRAEVDMKWAILKFSANYDLSCLVAPNSSARGIGEISFVVKDVVSKNLITFPVGGNRDLFKYNVVLHNLEFKIDNLFMDEVNKSDEVERLINANAIWIQNVINKYSPLVIAKYLSNPKGRPNVPPEITSCILFG